MKSSRIEGLARAIVLLVCGALIVVAVLSRSWVTTGSWGNTTAGPLGVQGCDPDSGACLTMGWNELQGDVSEVPRDVPIFAALTLYVGLAAAAMAGLCALLVLTRRARRVPSLLASGLIGGAAGLALYLEIRLLTTSAIGMGLNPSWAGILAIASTITAGVLVHSLSKLRLRASGAVASSSSSPSSWSTSSS